MKKRQRNPQLRLWDELVVDNFAGGGGASVGIERALGRHCDIAINHDPEAIAMHTENHPLTKHYCEDIWSVDPKEACGTRKVGLAWFSPDCTHFSRAKGTQPVKKEIRGLAWVVIRWAKAVRPRVIVLENVEEFQTWGPLVELEDGRARPCPDRKGQTFKRWVRHLRGLGYQVEWRTLRAADYGAPTTRRRLFLIARCDGLPIVWPEETHGEGSGLEPLRTAAEIIDWSLPCPSIFTRPRPLAENTLRRIAAGIERYVVNAESPFIVRTGHYRKGGAGDVAGKGAGIWRGQPLTQPLATVCATNDKNLVVPELRRVGQRGGGEATPLIAAWMAKHYGGVVGHGLERPIGTVTAKDHHALVLAFLTKYYGGGDTGLQGTAQSLHDPLHTIRAKPCFGLVEVRGTAYEITDIGMRMLAPRELYHAQGFPADFEIEVVDGLRLTKTAQTRMAGNSVCPDLSHALVKANYSSTARQSAAA